MSLASDSGYSQTLGRGLSDKPHCHDRMNRRRVVSPIVQHHRKRSKAGQCFHISGKTRVPDQKQKKKCHFFFLDLPVHIHSTKLNTYKNYHILVSLTESIIITTTLVVGLYRQVPGFKLGGWLNIYWALNREPALKCTRIQPKWRYFKTIKAISHAKPKFKTAGLL